jgi:TrmH family RNA methyltransferase
MIQKITSATNPLIKELRALATSKKARHENNRFIIEGWRGLKTLLEHPSKTFKIVQLIITSNWENDPRLPATLPTTQLPDPLFSKISDVKNAQGILGIIQHHPAPFTFNPTEGKYLLLDQLRDPGNLGTLIRSAVGAQFDGILLYGDCVDPFNPKTIRASMGTFAHINLFPLSDHELTQMRNAGYALYATTGSNGNNIYSTSFPPQLILAIGSEAHGLSHPLLQTADKKITIPLAPACESLNAAIAGSICMFQINTFD